MAAKRTGAAQALAKQDTPDAIAPVAPRLAWTAYYRNYVEVYQEAFGQLRGLHGALERLRAVVPPAL